MPRAPSNGRWRLDTVDVKEVLNPTNEVPKYGAQVVASCFLLLLLLLLLIIIAEYVNVFNIVCI